MNLKSEVKEVSESQKINFGLFQKEGQAVIDIFFKMKAIEQEFYGACELYKKAILEESLKSIRRKGKCVCSFCENVFSKKHMQLCYVVGDILYYSGGGCSGEPFSWKIGEFSNIERLCAKCCQNPSSKYSRQVHNLFVARYLPKSKQYEYQDGDLWLPVPDGTYIKDFALKDFFENSDYSKNYARNFPQFSLIGYGKETLRITKNGLFMKDI